jgi:hypothetical protein
MCRKLLPLLIGLAVNLAAAAARAAAPAPVLGRRGEESHTLTVVIWTVPDGGGAWATRAAVELWNEGLFYNASQVALSLQAFGDSYFNNSFACGARRPWNREDAACWLANCSAPWPPTKAMVDGTCYGQPQAPGAPVCRGGVRECQLMLWQDFIYMHYLDLPVMALSYYSCLQAGAANTSLVTADDVAQACATQCRVSKAMFEHLRDTYVHTWRGQEALGGTAQVTAWHLHRKEPIGTWPHITLQTSDRRVPLPVYQGPPTTAGLRAAICDGITIGTPPAACSSGHR